MRIGDAVVVEELVLRVELDIGEAHMLDEDEALFCSFCQDLLVERCPAAKDEADVWVATDKRCDLIEVVVPSEMKSGLESMERRIWK